MLIYTQGCAEREAVRAILAPVRRFTRGYVVDVGPKFFLTSLVSDRIWFDGFECFRIDDVSEVMVEPKNSFEFAARQHTLEAYARLINH